MVQKQPKTRKSSNEDELRERLGRQIPL